MFQSPPYDHGNVSRSLPSQVTGGFSQVAKITSFEAGRSSIQRIVYLTAQNCSYVHCTGHIKSFRAGVNPDMTWIHC
jgi:hypothetical protein